MVRPKGFEPLTLWFVAKYSIQLSYERIYTVGYTPNVLFMVASVGIEPTTQGFSVLCSTDWAMKPNKMAVPTRIELAIFCVTGRRDNRYTTEPFGCGGKIWTYDLWVMSPTSYQAALLRDIKLWMAEKEGFEPPRRLRPVGFQDRSLQPDLGISPIFTKK